MINFSRSAHAVLNLDWSVAVIALMPRIGMVTMLFQVTENIMTVESLLELPHKLLLGNVLLPDMEVALTDEQLFMDKLIICQTNFH